MNLNNPEDQKKYALDQIHRLIPDHPLLNKIQVEIWDVPGAKFAIFSSSETGIREINIPPKYFEKLDILNMILAHELGHLGQGVKIDFFAGLASKLWKAHPKISNLLTLISVYFYHLSGRGANHEFEADRRAIKMLPKIGYKPQQYLLAMDNIHSDILKIKSPMRRWLMSYSFALRNRKVRNLIARL